MDDNKFWISFWKTFAAFLFGVILVMSGCSVRKNELYFDAVKNGADPMALSCANNVGSYEQHICTLIAQKEKK